MILPLSTFPSATLKGHWVSKLIKKRKDDGKLQSLLQKIHCPQTEGAVSNRRNFSGIGGGCHLAVGINSQMANNNVLVTSVQGTCENKEISYQQSSIAQKVLTTKVNGIYWSSPVEMTTYLMSLHQISINVSDNSDSPKYITRVFDH